MTIKYLYRIIINSNKYKKDEYKKGVSRVIVTKIDMIFDIVKSEKKVLVSKVAKQVGIPHSNIMKILKDNLLITLTESNK